jgi:uncharacterized membrane protein YccC
MRLLLNGMAIATVVTVAGSNIYWQWADTWVACAVALGATFIVCLTVEKIAARFGREAMRREYGKDWN